MTRTRTRTWTGTGPASATGPGCSSTPSRTGPRAGRLGLRRHRSHEVEPLPRWSDCRIAHPAARLVVDGRPVDPAPVTETVLGRSFTVAADGFWQVHPHAPATLVEAVLAGASVRPGETVVDLYAGVGLFSAFLATATGGSGRVVAVEGGRVAAGFAEANLAPYPWVSVRHSPVDRALRWAWPPPPSWSSTRLAWAPAGRRRGDRRAAAAGGGLRRLRPRGGGP